MGLTPYREPAERVPDLDAPPRNIRKALQGIRSQHRTVSRLWRAAKAFWWLLAILGINLLMSRFDSSAWWALSGFLSITALLFGGEWLFRKRCGEVDLHHGGVVVRRWWKKEEILFEDVDELWLEGKRKAWGVRLLRFDGTSLTVPLRLEGGDRLREALQDACSNSLGEIARQALDLGDPLDFRAVVLTQAGMRKGGQLVPWEHFFAVRCSNGEVTWSTMDNHTLRVDIDRVPHPRLLIDLTGKLIAKARQQARAKRRVNDEHPPYSPAAEDAEGVEHWTGHLH